MSDPKNPPAQTETQTPLSVIVGDLVEATSPSLGTVDLRYDWIYLVTGETYMSGSGALMILGPDGMTHTIRRRRVQRVWRPQLKISIFDKGNS
jgi:hypothetical protein